MIIKRLKFHRERLKLSQDEMKTLIQQKYNCGFMRLSDDKIMELGFHFKASQTKEDFMKLMEQ